MRKDEYVRILDYLPNGKSDVPPHRRKPIAQAVGEKYFSLLELVPREGMAFEMGERNIHRGKRPGPGRPHRKEDKI